VPARPDRLASFSKRVTDDPDSLNEHRNEPKPDCASRSGLQTIWNGYGGSGTQIRDGGNPALSGSPQQYRGRAGAAGRDPRQQRRLLSCLGFPQADAFLRTAAPQDLRGAVGTDPDGQDGQS